MSEKKKVTAWEAVEIIMAGIDKEFEKMEAFMSGSHDERYEKIYQDLDRYYLQSAYRQELNNVMSRACG
jgi:hypothetical protein